MRSRRALLVAMALALVAVFLMWAYTRKKIGIIAGKYEKRAVVTASKEIRQNTIITEAMLEVKEIPEPYVEPNPITNKTDRVGYIAAINIQPGEQITEQKLIRPDKGLSFHLPKGKRAFTIAINDITGVAGLIRVGDNVDVIGVFKTLDKKTNTVGNAQSATILQNVRVLSLGRNYTIGSVSQDPGTSTKIGDVNFSNITLLLTPRQCMDLALAQELGNLALALRPHFDYAPPRIHKDLRGKRSTPSSVTGIKDQIDITPGPRWLEQRGDKSVWVR